MEAKDDTVNLDFILQATKTSEALYIGVTWELHYGKVAKSAEYGPGKAAGKGRGINLEKGR